MRWHATALVAALLCLPAAVRAEAVDLICTENSVSTIVYVKVDLTANTASAWGSGDNSAEVRQQPANINASQVSWDMTVGPYNLHYTLDRSNGALIKVQTPDVPGRQPNSYSCKRSSGAF